MDQVFSIYNPGNDFFGVKRAGAGPGPGPARPGPPGGSPHAVRGVPGHRTGANPAQSSSLSETWPTSVVCPSAVDGNIEIPSGGTPQDVLVFNMAATLEKYNDTGRGQVLLGVAS